MKITSFSVLEGGRVVVLHARKIFVSFAILEQRFCERSFEKTSHPPSSVKKCRCIVAWCDGKRRFNSAALSKKKDLIIRVGGRVITAKVVKVCHAAGEPAGMPAMPCGEVDARRISLADSTECSESQYQQVTCIDEDGSFFSTRFVETQLIWSKMSSMLMLINT